ncbi:hypothetical protein DRP77_06240 [Candidatus Poribacteria bacterium]|nr:MAG: hypothetical protein DRP77_06240 [Candidatus Poribacteria bacterium]
MDRKEELERLLRILPKSEPWERWLRESGELPPDFDSLPSIPDLPDPLEGVGSPEDWRRKRDRIKALFHRYVIGTVPPPPENLRSKVLRSYRDEGARVEEILLEFGPSYKAKLWMELMIPEGEGPFPVFMTQHNHRGWARIAVSRGYIGCVYAGADSRDDTDTFLEAYPEYDWSRLTRRAWAAGRCIDYLMTLPFVDKGKIALTGHSRNGKQSLIASALDERISVVISSSSGAGGAMPYRYFTEAHFGEGIELLTRVFPDWFHPRLRFFAGREHKLPVDNHELIALSAPRPCLLSIALNDPVESSWAMQQVYLAAKRVYEFLGAGDKIRIMWRPGSHETWATVIERYLDWCDLHFGRGEFDFPERLIHPCDFEGWRRRYVTLVSGEEVEGRGDPLGDLEDISSIEEWERRKEAVREEVRRMLGEEPPRVRAGAEGYGIEPGHIASMLGRGGAGEGIEKEGLVFGDYIAADVYTPAGLKGSGEKRPAVLWLHPFSFSNGYVAGYRRGEQVFRRLARRGYVVFCFDQIGFGRRIEEAEGFYERHPLWSLMGKMVRDVRAALDVLAELPYVDEGRIFGLGYALGGMVGLHVGILDDRFAGFASVCGFTPMRLDTPEKGTGGVRRWSHLYMLIPKLGFYIGRESEIPYDYHMLLAAFAPKPVLVVAPTLDREATVEDVRLCVERARRIYSLYGAEGNLKLVTPEDYNRFGPEAQDIVLEWLDSVSKYKS